MVWVESDLKAHVIPTPAMGRHSSHQPKLPKALSSPALGTCREEGLPCTTVTPGAKPYGWLQWGAEPGASVPLTQL